MPLYSRGFEVLKNNLYKVGKIHNVVFDFSKYSSRYDAYLEGKNYPKGKADLIKKTIAISSIANIPAIQVQAELIDKILHTEYLYDANINDFEYIRKSLRDLIKYIPKGKKSYDTHFEDDILSVEWNESNLDQTNLQNYKEKIEYYIKQHVADTKAISKLKENQPLSKDDIKDLEEIIWNQIGTKQDYYSEFGDKPLGEFVREIVGLDMNAAKEAFSKYLDETVLNRNQIYFVNQIIEYVVRNGVMKDMSVLQESPFTDKGTVADLFGDNINLWSGIREVINTINRNADYA